MIFAASEHPDNNKRPHTHTQLKQLNSLKDCFCMFAVIGYKKSVWGLKVMSRACELLERYVRESKSTKLWKSQEANPWLLGKWLDCDLLSSKLLNTGT